MPLKLSGIICLACYITRNPELLCSKRAMLNGTIYKCQWPLATTCMAREFAYTVIVDGEEQKETFTPADVRDERVLADRDVALAYAQHLAIQEYGYGIDVTTVEIEYLPNGGN